MIKIINIVNSLIKNAKGNSEIGNVTFVKAFKENLAENPIDGFIAVVKIENVNMSKSFVGGYVEGDIKGEMYTVNLVLEVYSGNDISGEALSDTTLKICNAIKMADENKIISSSNISPISFDNNINAIYRKINFELSFCLCGDDGNG